MSTAKREHRELISIEYQGQTHIGTLILRGTRKMEVWVNYQGKGRKDSRSWEPHEGHNMKVMGKALLLQMVAENEASSHSQ